MSQVVAICGTMGSGKSTVLETIASHVPDCRTLEEDDFNTAPLRSVDEIEAWFRRGGDVAEFDLSSLVDTLERTSSSPLILLETQFGRLHPQLRSWVDLQIWIDVPLDMALARKISQLATQFQSDFSRETFDDSLKWIAGFCEGYLTVTRELFVRQREQIAAQSDQRVDGTASASEVAASVLAAISR